MTGTCEIARIKKTKNGVGEKESTEEQNLGGEKNPHPELGRAVLLLEIVKLFGDE
jgi:hypothetical protein